jgi:hypothetical protein
MNNEEKNMEKYWNTLKAEDYSSSYDDTGAWLREAGVILNRKKGESKMKYIQNFIYANKLKFASLFIFAALVFAACSMPVTQQETLGHALTWTVSADNTEAIEQIDKLPWLESAGLTINKENVNGEDVMNYQFVSSEIDIAVIEGYKKQLEGITAIQKISLLPLNESVTRPVYAAALKSFFRINVDASNKTNEQVEQEIESQLRDAGFQNADISFGKDENGMRTFNMQLQKEPAGGPDKGFEIRVKDGDGNMQNEMVIKNNHGALDPEKLNKMTDAEIIDMIRKDMNNPNISDKDVTINRTDKGVMVSFANEKDMPGMKTKEKRELRFK